MDTNKYPIILACLILLSCLCAGPAMADDYAKNIELINTSINFARNEIPYVAYLSVELKNNGD